MQGAFKNKQLPKHNYELLCMLNNQIMRLQDLKPRQQPKGD